MTFHELTDRLCAYEQRYDCSTIEFYRRYRDGELGDDDDLMMWAGLYHLYLASLPVRQFMQSGVGGRIVLCNQSRPNQDV